MFDKYNDYFIENATVSELENAAHEVYVKWMKLEMGTPEYEELSNLHEKLVNKKLELCGNTNPNYRWTDENRWN